MTGHAHAVSEEEMRLAHERLPDLARGAIDALSDVEDAILTSHGGSPYSTSHAEMSTLAALAAARLRLAQLIEAGDRQ